MVRVSECIIIKTFDAGVSVKHLYAGLDLEGAWVIFIGRKFGVNLDCFCFKVNFSTKVKTPKNNAS